MESVLAPLAKGAFILLGLSAGNSAADAAIQKKIYGSETAALTFLNEEMEDIMKIIKSLQESGLLIKGIREIIKNEAKEQKSRFLSILLRTLATSTLENALAIEGVRKGGENF